MNLFTIASLSCGISCVILSVITLIFGKTKLHRILLWFNISVAFWGIGLALVGVAPTELDAIFGWRLAHFGGLFIATLFYHLVHVFCGLKHNKLLRFAYFQSIFFNVINVFFNQFSSKTRFVFGLYYNKANILFYLSVIIYVILLCITYYELLRFLKKAKGQQRPQTFYIIFGFLFGFVGGSSTFLPEFGADIIYPFGNFGITIYGIVVTYAILKHRLMDIRVFISHAVAFLVSYPFLLGIPFFFAYRMYSVIHPVWGMHWWLAPAGLLLFFASLAPLAYGQIRSKMEDTLLAEQKRYQKLLLQGANGMVVQHNLDRLSKLIVYLVKRIVKLDFASIFLDAKKEGAYQLKAVRNSGKPAHKDMSFSSECQLVKYLKEKKEPLLYEELPRAARDNLDLSHHVSLIVPSFSDDTLLGFILLGEKSNRQAFTTDDINVFKILSGQASLAIENCLFLQETKKAQERIFTAEKLASIGGMADGVAHQIKNRLNQFSVASGELKYEIKDFTGENKELISKNPQLKKTFDYLVKIGDSLIANVKKTDGIVKGILQFARVEEKETFFGKFSLKEIISLSEELLKVKHEVAQIPLKIKLGSSDKIYGVKAQITEAVYNVLDNGFEAIQEKRSILSGPERDKFKPLMEVILTQDASSYLVTISDNGVGVENINKHKIFAPFFTTKSSYKSGTGIGMYIVKRMVEENHNGKVWFKTDYLKGTTFFIKLPKK